jgi:hypothetical protein
MAFTSAFWKKGPLTICNPDETLAEAVLGRYSTQSFQSNVHRLASEPQQHGVPEITSNRLPVFRTITSMSCIYAGGSCMQSDSPSEHRRGVGPVRPKKSTSAELYDGLANTSALRLCTTADKHM